MSSLTKNANNIRNVSVIANDDQFMALDHIIRESKIKQPPTRYTDSRGYYDHDYSVRSGCIPLYYQRETSGENQEFWINLIGSPSHLHYSSDSSIDFAVTDGALVFVDTIDGISVQTETTLRQALIGRNKPGLIIDNVFRAITEVALDKESLYTCFSRIVRSVNTVISRYSVDCIPDFKVSPELGNVAFNAGIQGWAFTILQFANRYAKKFGVDPAKMMGRLWGDNYFNPVTRKWTTKSTAEDGTQLERSFNMFILDNDRPEDYNIMLSKLEINLSDDEKKLPCRELCKIVLRRFLPAAEAILEMIVIHLPSPPSAQIYRTETLYEGPMNDECAIGIKNCDPEAPLMVYISRMVPTATKGRFYAFGRVFSGTIRAGQKVRIQGPDYEPGKKNDLYCKRVQRTVLMIERFVEYIEDCSAGNIVGIVGISQFLVNSGTVTTSETAHNFKCMKTSAFPIVQATVDVKTPSNLPKLLNALASLARYDRSIVCSIIESTGQYSVAGTSDLHLETFLKELQEEYGDVPLSYSDPAVLYRETILNKSSRIALSKPVNPLNRLYMTAQPMSETITTFSESAGFISNSPSLIEEWKARAIQEDSSLAAGSSIWGFGPEEVGSNVLVNAANSNVKFTDKTPPRGKYSVDPRRTSKFYDEIKDSCISAFRLATRQGALANEPLRGCRFNIIDATFHSDTLGARYIIPSIRKVIHTSQLLSNPALLEPVILVDIDCPESSRPSVNDLLQHHTARIISEEKYSGIPVLKIKALLPIGKALGLITSLNTCTGGRAVCRCAFDHWESVSGSPFDLNSDSNLAVRNIRRRKGLPEEIPTIESYLDHGDSSKDSPPPVDGLFRICHNYYL